MLICWGSLQESNDNVMFYSTEWPRKAVDQEFAHIASGPGGPQGPPGPPGAPGGPILMQKLAGGGVEIGLCLNLMRKFAYV